MMEDKRENLAPGEEGFGPDYLTLTDEESKEHTFELVDTLDLHDNTYVALIAAPEDPKELLDGDGSLVIMKIVTEGEGEETEEILSLIEDDDEFDEVSDIFTERLSDLYEFEDGEDDNG